MWLVFIIQHWNNSIVATLKYKSKKEAQAAYAELSIHFNGNGYEVEAPTKYNTDK